METPQPKQGSNRNIIIGVVIAVVLCCCLAITAVGGYYGYKAYQVAKSAQQTIQDLQTPTDPSNPGQPGVPGIPGLGSGDLPEGGLADNVTRATAWGSLLFTGPIFNCATPTVAGTTIEVTKQPDASGVWEERWNVACGDGTSQTFMLTFTPEGGLTNVNIAPPQ